MALWTCYSNNNNKLNLFRIISINSTKYGLVSKTFCVCKLTQHKVNPIQMAVNLYLKFLSIRWKFCMFFVWILKGVVNLRRIYSIHRIYSFPQNSSFGKLSFGVSILEIIIHFSINIMTNKSKTYIHRMQNVSTEKFKSLEIKKKVIK